MSETAAETAGIGSCATAEGLVVEAAFPSDVVRQGDNDFQIASRCRRLGLASGAGDVLLGLASFHSCSAAPRWGWATGVSPGECSCGTGADVLSDGWKTRLGLRPGF